METKSKQKRNTLGLLDKLRSGGVPVSRSAAEEDAELQGLYEDQELPDDSEAPIYSEEELAEDAVEGDPEADELEADMLARKKQQMAGQMVGKLGTVDRFAYGVGGGQEPGPAGVSPVGEANSGVSPYAPGYLERLRKKRRQNFSAE